MKKLLIMSMVLLLGVTSGFSQVKTRTVKTVKSKTVTAGDVKQKFSETKNKAAEALKNKNVSNKGTVTRPSSNVGTRGDYVLDNDGGQDKILIKPGSRDTRVTRPSSNVGTRGDYQTSSQGGTYGGNDLLLLKPGSRAGKVTRTSESSGTKGKIGDDGGVQDMWDDSRMKPTNGKTNVVNRRGGTRRR